MSLETYGELAAEVLRREPRLGPVRLVAVDGRAGSGKTTFARRFSYALRRIGATVGEIHTDDLLEGWTDMVSFWPRLREWILDPLARGEEAGYRVYDWHAKGFGEQWQALPVPDVLVLEGVTTARRAVRADLTLGVCVLADRDLRLARGIERDGEALRAEWVRWMAAEDTHFAEDKTVEQVELLVDGAPAVEHDPENQYLRV
jgi:uridine kinase